MPDAMFGALATGLKTGNDKVLGDPQGRAGEAAGRCGVNLTGEGAGTAEVAQEHRQAWEGLEEVERDSRAQSWGLGGKETGNDLAFFV